jgi:hypothetical protein
MSSPELQLVIDKLARIEASLEQLAKERIVKEWYATAELAEILGKAEFTIREWCRLRRVNAEKRSCGRGSTLEWIVSHEELVRIQNHGLLPLPKRW